MLFVGMISSPRTQRASHFECLAAATAVEAHRLYLSLYLSSGLRAEPARARI